MPHMYCRLGAATISCHQAFSKEFAAHNRWLSILADTRMICKCGKIAFLASRKVAYNQQETLFVQIIQYQDSVVYIRLKHIPLQYPMIPLY